MLAALNILLHGLHSALILFNLLGLFFPRWRRLHLVSIVMTTFSWFILGAFYGLGYCLLTDWHWQIKERLGERQLPDSYIKYVVDGILGVNSSPFWVDVCVLMAWAFTLVMSIFLNYRQGTFNPRIPHPKDP